MYILSNISFHWSPFVRGSVDNKPRVKLLTGQNTKNTLKIPVSHKVINSTSQDPIAFRPNAFKGKKKTLVTGHKLLTTWLHHAKPLPSSKSCSWVTNNTHMGLQETEWSWGKIWLSYHSPAAARCSPRLCTTSTGNPLFPSVSFRYQQCMQRCGSSQSGEITAAAH
jgi:hypothetical protein